MSERLLSVMQVCDALSVSRRTVERLIERGSLRAVRVGRRRLVRESDLDRFLGGLQ